MPDDDSWRSVVYAAGVEPPGGEESIGDGAQKPVSWTEERITVAVSRALSDGIETLAAYQEWQQAHDAPGKSTIYKRFGGWGDVKAAARERLDESN